MSAPVDHSEATKQVVKYLEDHKLTEELNRAVNVVCKAKPEDAYGALVNELLKLCKPPVISKLVGREVLDSRANPTVEVDVFAIVRNEEKFAGRQAGPSGASTGSNEALELRDDEKDRYLGKGVRKAVSHVNGPLTEAVKGMEIFKQKEIDDAICQKDGTRLKTNLGGNAITAASFAIADAAAHLAEKELFEHLANVYHKQLPGKFSLPRPMVNILNGGKHAGGNLKIQEFMIVPKAESFAETLRHISEVYHHLGKILVKKYGVSAKNLGDEGGYAPSLDNPDEALTLIESAIAAAGLKVGEDMFLALDAASSEFYEDGKYEVKVGEFKTSDEMVDFYIQMKKDHPSLISIEDGLAEKDYAGWIKLTERFKSEFKDVMLVGDDLYTTNTDLIKTGIEQKWANALLLKVNQIGTISEAMDAARMIFADNGNVIVSHRSGETPGSLISDLSVAIGAQFIKTGAPARGERTAKYNRLLQIEDYLLGQGKLNQSYVA